MRTEVLDHGYVELVEAWGSDERIVEAARMSTGKGFKGWGRRKHAESCQWEGEEDKASNCSCGYPVVAGDEKLLRFLWEHKHTSPFEMAGMTVEAQAPIFVFREWHRHRTQSYNEMSARYTALPDSFYVPSMERMKAARQDQINKQGSGGQPFNDVEAQNRRDQLEETYAHCRRQYVDLLAMGVAREIARLVIPVAQYSRMRASANLLNWLRFLTLRLGEDAQWEIRQYAAAIGEEIKRSFPRTWELYEEGRHG